MAYTQHSGIYRERGRKGNGEYMNSYQKRQAWTKEEDEILKQQVSRLGTHCWPDVASGLPGRTSKACSLRWRCFLSPTIIRPNEEPFSQWEIAVIVLTQKMFGNKWNDIAAYLPMRCNNDIKNHFNLYLKDKQHQVALENSFLRQGYDLPSLLASEPEEVATRREKLEKERTSSNNLEHGAVKAVNRSAAFIRPRASPSRPKPSPRFSPYHLALAEAAAGQVIMTGITRSGSGPSLAGTSDSDTASPSSHHNYPAFTAHSGHSMGALDALTLGGAFRAQPALAAAGLPASLVYSTAFSAPYSPNSAGMAGYMQQACKPEVPLDGGNMCSSYAGYHLAGYAAMPVLSSSSGASGTASPPAVMMDDMVVRQPSRLAVAGHPGDMADYTCAAQADSCMSYTQYTDQQQQQQQPGQPALHLGSHQQGEQLTIDGSCDAGPAGLPHFMCDTSLDQMPSLPEPAEQGMLEGGDADGPSLRGIFSSDDGEAHMPQQQQQQQGQGQQGLLQLPHSQPQQQGQASSRVCLPGIDLSAAAAAAVASGSHDGSPPSMHLGAQGETAGFPSPNDFTSSGASPMYQLQQQSSNTAAEQPLGQGLRREAHTDTECASGSVHGGVMAAEGDGVAAVSAGCGVRPGHAHHGYSEQHQQQGMLPQGAFTQSCQDLTYHHHQQYQHHHHHHHHVYAVLPEQQQLPAAARYTPFGHPQNQQQHLNHIFSNDSHSQTHHHQQQQMMMADCQAYQPAAGVDGFDSGKSSHLNAMNSPATMAQSAVAALARLAQKPQDWSSSPSSAGIKQEQGAAPEQQLQLQRVQQQAHADLLQLLPRTPSVDLHEELGPLADLLGDNSGDPDDPAGCDPSTLEDDLLAAAVAAGGYDDHGDHHHIHTDLDLLPGLTRQNSELEMIATATCW